MIRAPSLLEYPRPDAMNGSDHVAVSSDQASEHQNRPVYKFAQTPSQIDVSDNTWCISLSTAFFVFIVGVLSGASWMALFALLI